MSMDLQSTVHDRPSDQRDASDDALVRSLSGFVPLSTDERACLATLTARTRTVPAHTDLVGEGDIVDAALVILNGFAGRCRVRREGRRQVLAYLLPGDLHDLDIVLRDR